ncbi:hypothetical protein EVAR_47820_1 [Eumeta japonica]|uniref:Uncharacterized protein n=1 Tax=Eumeta variegata TaxID=151549 RepID=A0A4C1YW19_EUMVA|nr:hypothetical protein EVAR_47820_1 [Eumeta japonica]
MHWRGGVVIEREGMRERKKEGERESSVAQQNPYLLQARRKELRSNKLLLKSQIIKDESETLRIFNEAAI